jgi:hypothetical protein
LAFGRIIGLLSGETGWRGHPETTWQHNRSEYLRGER